MEHLGGEESCAAGESDFAFPFCKPAPLPPPLGQSEGLRAALRSGPPSCPLHFLQVAPSFLPGCVLLSASYQNATHFCLQFLLHFRHLPRVLSASHFLRLVWAVPGECVRCLLGALFVELANPLPLVVSGCQPVSPEHWPPGDSSSLPSPLLFFSRLCSVMMGRASRWWWPFCSAVLLCVLSR